MTPTEARDLSYIKTYYGAVTPLNLIRSHLKGKTNHELATYTHALVSNYPYLILTLQSALEALPEASKRVCEKILLLS